MARRLIAIGLFAVGIAVFLIRLQHPGAYAFPERGNLAAALLAFALGAWFSYPWLSASRGRRVIDAVFFAATPVVLFFSVYATLAELEEVVVVKTTDPAGRPVSLRLWVTDAEGTEWVSMPREKAIVHGLASKRVEFSRAGEWFCRQASLVEDRAIVSRNDRLLSKKYAVKRLAVMIGVFGNEPSPSLVSVRLDPCASS